MRAPVSEEPKLSWEEAVRWYRAQPDSEAAIRANFFDLPVLQAAQRYAAGEEFAEVARLLGPGGGRHILDLGAGNGIASYAFARAGWRVTALEPDPSTEVGAGAIREIQTATDLPITIVTVVGDTLPLAEASCDAVFARQVLHHVPDLRQTMRELYRILRPQGCVLAIREHVVHDAEELARFRGRHPLHHLYGGENAYPLDTYLSAGSTSGFVVEKTWGPLESILNFFPGTEDARQRWVRHLAHRRFLGLGRLFARSPEFIATALRTEERTNPTPGRIHSFLLRK